MIERGKDRRDEASGRNWAFPERRQNPERRMPRVDEISLDEFYSLMDAGNKDPGGQQPS